ncbi:MAG: Re/Si-specific NAD(P)(+) transhydrogenase subunit alpha [Myxococcota bacterium]
MKVFVPRERADGETRVAVVPETVKRLIKEGFEVAIEAGAGTASHLGDAAYQEAGARIVQGPEAATAFREANVVLKVGPPTDNDALGAHEADSLGEGALIVASMAPHKNLEAVGKLRDRKASGFAMELIPRITRAQGMDALSSQASIAGYKAAVLAAAHLDKYFPLLTTAAGTIQPARVVIMGAGVAGLQALATAKRLGAVVEVSDIRPAVKEQIESLGGKFIDVPMEEGGEDAGGYAKEVSKEFLQKQQEIVKQRVLAADAVITTALVPGKPAPKLITAEMVQGMRPGAVIVDLAVEQGGNCELSQPGEDVVEHGVLIVGHRNLPATMPRDASTLYARNVLAVMLHLAPKGELTLDLEDEITTGALLTHQGEVRHEPTRNALGGTS